MVCSFCNKKEKIYGWGEAYCVDCNKIKNIGAVYGYERILKLLERCCIRDEAQLEKKIGKETVLENETKLNKSVIKN
jgi:hypothetical protein